VPGRLALRMQTGRPVAPEFSSALDEEHELSRRPHESAHGRCDSLTGYDRTREPARSRCPRWNRSRADAPLSCFAGDQGSGPRALVCAGSATQRSGLTSGPAAEPRRARNPGRAGRDVCRCEVPREPQSGTSRGRLGNATTAVPVAARWPLWSRLSSSVGHRGGHERPRARGCEEDAAA
jgi:hypothetical protein